MRNFYLTVIFLLLVIRNNARGTTVVIAVTPDGIVMGADSKGTPSGTVLKIVLLKGKYILASLYAENAKAKSSGIMVYDFPVWAKQIEHDSHGINSLTALTEFISHQMLIALAQPIKWIETGDMTKSDAARSGVDSILVQYIIAGYENGVPIVYSLCLIPDWDAKVVNGPFKVQLREVNGQKSNSFIHYEGQRVSLDRISTTDSNEQKEFFHRVPIEAQALRSHKDLTIKQATHVVRAMLGMEAKVNPSYVGFPLTLVTVPRRGMACTQTFDQDVSPSPVAHEPPERRKPVAAATPNEPSAKL